LLFVWVLAALAVAASAQELPLIPYPKVVERGSGNFAIEQLSTIEATGPADPLRDAAITRVRSRLERRLGHPLIAQGKKFTIETVERSSAVQQAKEDEAYELTISAEDVNLKARNAYGIQRGMETFFQLFERSATGWRVPAVTVRDEPRFAWRGLMLDVSRHFLHVNDVLRTLDGMAAVKLNVLHLHLSDDQGFRVESKRYPKLQLKASGGQYYTQADIRRIVAYARDRAIRVIPEFDVPGHVTALLAAYPELASVPGTYQPEKQFGAFDATLDPTAEFTYQFLDNLFAEMIPLFPDPYFHIGADEVNGKQWDASPRITKFKTSKGWKSFHDLQAYFVRRVAEMMEKRGKKVIAWDEVLRPDLPDSITVQAWRGQRSIVASTRSAHETVVSTGYYLDWMQPAWFHYQRDPAAPNPAWNDRYDDLLGKLVTWPNTADWNLNPSERAKIIGAEATMWAEFTTPLNLDIRLWPRLAAIAERFWSPADRRDVASLYRRFDPFGLFLENEKIPFQSGYVNLVRRLTTTEFADPLISLAGILEPPKWVARILTRKYTTESKLDRLADIIRPESIPARRFDEAVDRLLRDGGSADAIRTALETWQGLDARLEPAFESERLAEVRVVSKDVNEVATIGLRALEAIEKKQPAPADWVAASTAKLKQAGDVKRELRVAVADPVQKLVDKAARP
jgi:hexosaminidase